MQIEEKLLELDQLFQEKRKDQIEKFLSNTLIEAINEQDTSAMITILNEMIGYYRDMSEYEKGLIFADRLDNLMIQSGLVGSVYYATTLLNIANLYRAAGKLTEALTKYENVLQIYQEEMPSNDIRFASFYNNRSLLYEEMAEEDSGFFEKARDDQKSALAIVKGREKYQIEEATTHANLATVLVRTGEIEQADRESKQAVAMFEELDPSNFHYGMALSSRGDVLYAKKELNASQDCYERALVEWEKNTGRGEAYFRILSNLQTVLEQKGMSELLKGMSLAREYYESFGKQMIHEKFPEYENRIAIGYVGEGSDCFGFDDLLSMDHDFGPGFCLWVTEETYQKIGSRLQEAYEQLPSSLHGITRGQSVFGEKRTGVQTISGFYQSITGYSKGPHTLEEWLLTEEWKLATATNGCVFHDPEGIFTNIRCYLLSARYDCSISQEARESYLRKLSQELITFCQYGQYNYERLIKREDKPGARLCANHALEAAVHIIYLLNHRYSPHDKWLFYGSHQLPVLQKTTHDILSIYGAEKIEKKQFETIAAAIVAELNHQQITESRDTYLQEQAFEIMNSYKMKENLSR